jgi:hypothetical protein
MQLPTMFDIVAQDKTPSMSQSSVVAAAGSVANSIPPRPANFFFATFEPGKF